MLSKWVNVYRYSTVNDVVTKDCFRADHLVEENLEKMLADPMITPERRRELEDMNARLEVGGCTS